MMMHLPHVKILNGVGSGLRDGPLEKLWVGGGGGGGGGVFGAAGFFFCSSPVPPPPPTSFLMVRP